MLLLTNVTYIDKDQKVANGNILITDGMIKISRTADLCVEQYNISEIIDCRKYIIISGLINGHYHNASLLARGLSKEIAISEWEGESLQGKLQSTLFQYLDEGRIMKYYERIIEKVSGKYCL